MNNTRIEWADATVNPILGCSPASPACDHCYAARMAHRLGANPATPQYAGLTDAAGRWTGEVRWSEAGFKNLCKLADARTPKRVFVGSMTDLFHPTVPDERLDIIFLAMARAPQHTFLILTKRPERMRSYILGAIRRGMTWREGLTGGIPPLIWLGVTAENQAQADARIPILLDTPAARRFVSIEPMLGPVDMNNILPAFATKPSATCGQPWGRTISVLRGTVGPDHRGRHEYSTLDWVIAGGETGPGARPSHPQWFRSLRDQCEAAGVPFFFKGWGEWVKRDSEAHGLIPLQPVVRLGAHGKDTRDLANCEGAGHEVYMQRVGKPRSGRLLDGREWNEVPA